MKSTTRFAPLLFLAGLAAGVAGATCARPVDSPAGSHAGESAVAAGLRRTFLPAAAFAADPGPAAGQVSLADVAERVVPSVVNVAVSQDTRGSRSAPPELEQFFGFGLPDPGPRHGEGSGVIVSADGLVLTNNHVVDGADDIEVRLSDGRELKAKVVGTDPKTDLAVVRLQGELGTLTPISIGSSDELRLGDVVLAVGNPLGVGQSVTMGIVSALGRANVRITDYDDFIQTDAAINPGNSGGALVNTRGELVGINTAILSRTGGYQGIGFAIPTAIAKPILDSLVSTGKVARGWLGVSIQDLDAELAKGLALDIDRGVLIADVTEGSPADKAGVKRGDVIVGLDGAAMTESAKLRNRIAAAGPDSDVKLEIVRGKDKQTITVHLGELEQGLASAEAAGGSIAFAGASLGALDDTARSRFGIAKQIDSGVVVTAVDPSGAAARAGLRPGDVIREIDRKPVGSLAAAGEALAHAQGATLLLVQRGNSTIYMAVRLG
jgi:serine protease Do